MKRINKKSVRVVAFIGALGASAALVGTAATATGAYFTDSRDGSLSATTGHIRIDTNSDPNISMSNLLPGDYQKKDVVYTTNGSQAEDVWVVFNTNDPSYLKLTGGGNPDNGLGGYGHFAIANNAGNDVFSSWNLRNAPDGSSGCANAIGQGGNGRNDDYVYNHNPAGPNDTYCGIPGAIKLESGLNPGTTFKFTMTFGYTPKLTDTGNADGYRAEEGNIKVPFKVVATQVGVTPNATFAPVG